MGDSDTGYTMQSTSKPFNYAIAHEILGDDLHEFVGREPSGNFWSFRIFSLILPSTRQAIKEKKLYKAFIIPKKVYFFSLHYNKPKSFSN